MFFLFFVHALAKKERAELSFIFLLLVHALKKKTFIFSMFICIFVCLLICYLKLLIAAIFWCFFGVVCFFLLNLNVNFNFNLLYMLWLFRLFFSSSKDDVKNQSKWNIVNLWKVHQKLLRLLISSIVCRKRPNNVTGVKWYFQTWLYR